MSALTADQAIVILNGVGLPSLNAEHPVTKRVIAAIPAAKADYRPDPVARSAIDLAWHIVTAENRFLEAVISGFTARVTTRARLANAPRRRSRPE